MVSCAERSRSGLAGAPSYPACAISVRTCSSGASHCLPFDVNLIQVIWPQPMRISLKGTDSFRYNELTFHAIMYGLAAASQGFHPLAWTPKQNLVLVTSSFSPPHKKNDQKNSRGARLTTRQTIASPTPVHIKISAPISKKILSRNRTHIPKNLSHLDLNRLCASKSAQRAHLATDVTSATSAGTM